ncbi:PDR/VanB family oxidoreductase [Paraburkholderia terrae]
MSQQQSRMRVRLTQIRLEANAIASFELRPITTDQPLPAFTAGAHVDVHMPGDRVRSYSLVNDQEERDRYLIAVQHETTGRGGSAWLHTVPRVGMELEIGMPVNDFPLNEAAEDSVFIAGGIGITPILSMIRRLERLGRRWRLYYAARAREHAAFVEPLATLNNDTRVRLFFGSTPDTQMSIQAAVEDAPRDAHFYCCGPRGMLDAFLDATSARPSEQVHFERFGAATEAATTGGFEIELAKSGRRMRVEAGKTMLDVLVENGVPVQYACSAGVCGTCKTAVLGGVPDHRDEYLTDDEKRSNKVVMVCCSGSQTESLCLDL